ncbi:MAG: hydantoinase B/oxoprolinase family protein [Candidatus Puniceispirillales bacterium]
MTKDTSPAIDPVTANVIQGALQNIAIEMGYKLMRMSYSSIIRESEDFGTALTDAKGNQLAESVQSTPLQSGPIPGYVKNVIEVFENRGTPFKKGDVIMHNDPYGGASHGPDIALIVPVFYGDKLIGFSGTTAHHLDVGALSPGSCGIVDAIDVYAEGLQFKAIKVYDGGERNEAVWQILKDNVRAPGMVVGDMEAQVAACQIGAERFIDLVDRYGLQAVDDASEALMDYSERLMRDAIRNVPDGVYSATTFIDGFLEDPERRDLPLVVTITISGDEMVVDLEGTAPQVADRPINMPLIGTVDISIWLTVRSVLLDSDIYGYIPQNSGLVRPITLKVPRGCLANPIFPAPVIARFTPGNQLADTVMKALAEAVPEQVSAGIGNLKVIAFSGLKEETHWVHMEIFEGSYGGRFNRNGMDAVDTLYANTRNNPIEDIESHLPMRVTRYELREDTSGAGRTRGGLGACRAFQFLEPGGFSVEGEGHKFAPWGFKGGQDGKTAELHLIHSDGQSEALTSKVPYHKTATGDTFFAIGPSAGGYGDAFDRSPEDVFEDVLDELISVESAERDYGVIISNGSLDMDATAKRRNR